MAKGSAKKSEKEIASLAPMASKEQKGGTKEQWTKKVAYRFLILDSKCAAIVKNCSGKLKTQTGA
jgi:hypothetical protein